MLAVTVNVTNFKPTVKVTGVKVTALNRTMLNKPNFYIENSDSVKKMKIRHILILSLYDSLVQHLFVHLTKNNLLIKYYKLTIINSKVIKVNKVS